MSDDLSRRDVMGLAARCAALAGLGGTSAFLAVKAHGNDAWHIDTSKCVNSRLGAVGVEVCQRCATECVLPLSAVRAVNEFADCGRCYICPAYFDIHSAIGPDGLPSKKLCPRDAIERQPIGWIDPDELILHDQQGKHIAMHIQGNPIQRVQIVHFRIAVIYPGDELWISRRTVVQNGDVHKNAPGGVCHVEAIFPISDPISAKWAIFTSHQCFMLDPYPWG